MAVVAPLFMRSVRTAAWVLCLALATLAFISGWNADWQAPPPFASPSEQDFFEHERVVYVLTERSRALLNLILGLPLLMAGVQALRASGIALYGRLVRPSSARGLVDKWAFQAWGPLMLENLVYLGYLAVALAFLWRYQTKLGLPVLSSGDAQLLAQEVATACLLTVAGAYASLLQVGPGGVLAPFAVGWMALPAPLSALLTLLLLRGGCPASAALRLGEAPSPAPRGAHRAGVLVVLCLTVMVCPLLLLIPTPSLLGLLEAGLAMAAVLGALRSEYATAMPSFFETALLSVVGLVFSAILVPNFMRPGHSGKLTACKSNLKNIGTALEMYATDNGGRYPLDSSRLTPNYLKTIPTCPGARRVTYSFSTASSPDLYTVVCQGWNHRDAGIQAFSYPRYTCVNGLVERP